MNKIENTEEYCTELVVEGSQKGYSKISIPVSSMSQETATALAKQLNISVAVKDTDYIFSTTKKNTHELLAQGDEKDQKESPAIEMDGNVKLDENFSHFENNNGNF